MKWTTTDDIRLHSRIDDDVEDKELTPIANAAEQAILNVCNRTQEELEEMGGGTMPDPIRQATLVLIDHWYVNRAATTGIGLSEVPYSIDFMIKPYIRL